MTHVLRREVNQTDVMLKIVEMASMNGALPPDHAISLIAILIDRLDMHSDNYEHDVEALLKIGATIWSLSHD